MERLYPPGGSDLIRYNTLKAHLSDQFGCRVRKLPLSTGLGCPNRNPSTGTTGCIFCDSTGSGFNALSPEIPVRSQIQRQLREKALENASSKWIGYFQSFTNTFATPQQLKQLFEPVLEFPEIVILDVSTRPDQVPEPVLDILESFSPHIEVWVELGLQSVNPRTLQMIRRGHGLMDFIDAVRRTKNRGIPVIAHAILDLPWDAQEDVEDMAKLFSSLGIDGVKTHSLYVVEDTPLADMVDNGLELLTFDAFMERTIRFLELLDPKIVIHRLVSDPPRHNTRMGNWGMPKIQILNRLDKEMENRDTCQGKRFQYLHR